MTRIPSLVDSGSPPPYDDRDRTHEDADLQQMLSALTIDGPSTPPRGSSRSARLYAYQNANTAGITTSWSEAAALTQGVAGGSSLRLTPKSKSKARVGAYVVFFGRVPGVYEFWYEEAEPHVKGVKGSLYQGYQTPELATAAYEYARERGWTHVLPCPRIRFTTAPILRLPTPVGALDDTPNPLHNATSTQAGIWYVVFRGICPGVYQSSLECSLNTVGLSRATYLSFASKDLALAHFQDAVANGEVEVLTPKYVT
ncbi:hypothetical protein DFH06DRAFT_1349478 [Mycena polygramma]|nr:hypothetical protein DFH06DRAFT_1349478 [Mycena polygramma]